MLIKKYSLSICFVICTSCIATAQDTSRSSKSYFKASVSYLTNSVFNGRKDSATLPYITPTIGYFNKSGFYLSASFSYLTATANAGIDLFSVQTGYDFNITDKFYGGVYASKYFYNNASTDVRAESKGGVGGSLNYDTKIANLTTGVAAIFSGKTDLNVYGAVSHPFYIGDDWGISPTATTNLGSQNYYRDFIVNRKSESGSRGRGSGRGRDSGGSGGGTTTSTVTTSATQFGILDYEFSLPISYYGNKWGVHLTPIYAIPQNPVSVKSSSANVYIAEKLENSFYAQLTAYIKF